MPEASTIVRLRRAPRKSICRALLTLFWLGSAQLAQSYSVLTHEQLIDLSWNSSIRPLLLSRFPSLTPEELRIAHSYAYGGCVIQDVGYYPFGNSFFSDLTHYVRSGDFVESLFKNAHTADELAFAVGALAHYVGDSLGHSIATNTSVPIEFPKLAAKYGSSVNYAQAKYAHGRVEFAFDIYQIAKERLPPSEYLHYIGFRVPRRQLAIAFSETYGLNIGDILGIYRAAVRSYRFGARSFLPAIANAEVVIHRRRFPAETPSPELALYEQNMKRLHPEADWHAYRRKAGIGTYLLAGLIVILPKIGPISMLAIKGPTVDTQRRYLESVNLATATLHHLLEQISHPPPGPAVAVEGDEPVEASQTKSAEPLVQDKSRAAMQARVSAPYARALPPSLVPNRDLDTGRRVIPGGYPLTDKTYAKLLARVTAKGAAPIPAGLKEDILRYYADPDAPIVTKRNSKKWARLQQNLQILIESVPRSAPD